MGKPQFSYADFIGTVDDGCRPFVDELHQELAAAGCTVEITEAKSGFVVSYLFDKKTVANYVFRKKGLIIRIYANHVDEYMDFLEGLPEGMARAVQRAPICKRLTGMADCNSKCAMGYDFTVKGERHQKCRYNAFLFPLNEENNPFIRDFLKRELAARDAA